MKTEPFVPFADLSKTLHGRLVQFGTKVLRQCQFYSNLAWLLQIKSPPALSCTAVMAVLPFHGQRQARQPAQPAMSRQMAFASNMVVIWTPANKHFGQ